MDSHASLDIHIDMFCNGNVHFTEIHFLKVVQIDNADPKPSDNIQILKTVEIDPPKYSGTNDNVFNNNKKQ